MSSKDEQYGNIYQLQAVESNLLTTEKVSSMFNTLEKRLLLHPDITTVSFANDISGYVGSNPILDVTKPIFGTTS